ncbi:hypothetical protein [Pseudomonas sp.]|uniref:hypothetical protein n=1 Tax=Pseudomonas sp. TaxID=306 RepID=UPI003D0F9494
MELLDFIAHWIGKKILRAVSAGRFTGELGYQSGFAEVIGGVVLLSPLVALVAWKILS